MKSQLFPAYEDSNPVCNDRRILRHQQSSYLFHPVGKHKDFRIGSHHELLIFPIDCTRLGFIASFKRARSAPVAPRSLQV